MTFLVILVALMIERFFDWSHLRVWQWLPQLKMRLSQKHMTPILQIVILILPLLAMIFLIQLSIKGVLYGVLSFLFQLIVLTYSFGPQNFWADAFATENLIKSGNGSIAYNLFQDNKFKHTHPVGYTTTYLPLLFLAAHRRLFVPLFWFAVLGPVGAFGYRLCSSCANELFIDLQDLLNITEWLPVRIQIILFSLVGHFSHVLHCWRAQENFHLENENLLMTCGMAAVNDHQTAQGVEKQIINLIDRSLVLCLVVLAIIVILC